MGTGFYLKYRHDFDPRNAFEAFKMRKMRKLMKEQNLDFHKLEFLKDYIQTMEEQLRILKNEA